MSSYLVAYLVTGGLFAVLDIAWLTVMSSRFYRPQLGSLMREQIALPPSVGFYLVYVGVLTALVVIPAAAAADSNRALVNGLLLGCAAYATYNLTNAATLKAWPSLLTIVDWTWGTLATGVTAWLAVQAIEALGGAG